ncbi:hypothetical protein GR11A_00066 [Vibrio phage vB_VcorM_GR11A]|nr:hypothetical protein GR11A_00066 [Vibrio phage vB_VcorM_GR11A]
MSNTTQAFIKAVESLTKYPEHPVKFIHSIAAAYLVDLEVPEAKRAICEKQLCHLFGHHVASRHDLARTKKGKHSINPWIPIPRDLLNKNFYAVYNLKVKSGKTIWQHLMDSKDNPLFKVDTYYRQTTEQRAGKCRRYRIKTSVLETFYELCVKAFVDIEKNKPKMCYLSGAYGRTFCVVTGIDIASELKRLHLQVTSKKLENGIYALVKERGRRIITTADYDNKGKRVQFPRLQSQAIANACSALPIDMVEAFNYLDDCGARLFSGEMEVGSKEYNRFMNDFWAIQRMCECKYIAQSPRFVEFYPSYDTRATFGSRTFGNPIQSLSSKVKQSMVGPFLKAKNNPYHWQVINYDIESSQLYFLSVIFKAYGIKCKWLTKFLKDSSKSELAEKLGIDVKTLKIILYALVFGAPFHKEFRITVINQKKQSFVDEMYSGLVDHGLLQADDYEIEKVFGGAIIEAIYNCLGSKSKAKKVYTGVYDEFLELHTALEQLDDKLFNDSYKPRRTSGRGRHWKNSVGAIISEADLKGDARKRKSSLRAHILQGMESAWVYYVINKMAEVYERPVVCGIEHDGFIANRKVTDLCVEDANNNVNSLTSLSKLKNLRVSAKLIEKPFHK